MKSKKRVECPTCRETFHLESWLRIGNQVLCPYCEELLEIVKLNPFTLACAYSTNWREFQGEDWDGTVSRKQVSRHH